MRFIIENANIEYIDQLAGIMRESTELALIGIENIDVCGEWVVIQEFEGGFHEDELLTVVSFEFPHFNEWEDVIMPVLTQFFEGSNLMISSPDLPGLRMYFA